MDTNAFHSRKFDLAVDTGCDARIRSRLGEVAWSEVCRDVQLGLVGQLVDVCGAGNQRQNKIKDRCCPLHRVGDDPDARPATRVEALDV